MKVSKCILLLVCSAFVEAQSLRCPVSTTKLGIECYQESPFTPVNTTRECFSHLSNQLAVMNRIATLKASGKFDVKEFKQLRKRHKDLSKKIDQVCWQ